MTHSALTRAQELYDLPRDLEPHEQTFLSAVHRITMHCARTKGEAIRAWGDGSRAYDAVAFLSNQQQSADLTNALEAFERDVEAADELEQVGYAMAAE